MCFQYLGTGCTLWSQPRLPVGATPMSFQHCLFLFHVTRPPPLPWGLAVSHLPGVAFLYPLSSFRAGTWHRVSTETSKQKG